MWEVRGYNYQGERPQVLRGFQWLARVRVLHGSLIAEDTVPSGQSEMSSHEEKAILRRTGSKHTHTLPSHRDSSPHGT